MAACGFCQRCSAIFLGSQIFRKLDDPHAFPRLFLASGGTAAYAQLEYLKDTVNTVSDADYDPQYEIFFASDETLSKGYFLVGSSGIYRVRSVYLHLAGFNTAVSDKLDVTAPATGDLYHRRVRTCNGYPQLSQHGSQQPGDR